MAALNSPTGSSTDSSTDSSRTLGHSDIDDHLTASQYTIPSVDGEPLPDPDYFGSLFEDVKRPVQGPPTDVPAVEDIIWDSLPSPDQFEVDDEPEELQAPDDHRARVHAETYLDMTPGPEGGVNGNCILSVLRAYPDPRGELAAIILYVHQANIMRGLEARWTPARVATIAEASNKSPLYGEVLLEKVFEELDKTGVHLITYYSRSGFEMTHFAGWVHEPIPQLRIRIKAPTEDRLKDFGTEKITWERLQRMLAQEGSPHHRPTDAHASLFIRPTYSAGRQVQLAYQTEMMNNEDRQRFMEQHSLGAVSNLTARFPKGVNCWLSWIDDGRAEALRVNRVVVGRPFGQAQNLVGLLNHCIDQADVHYMYKEVIVWDPPPEMWDAALALADDEKHGARYEVYKEEVKDLKCFVR